LRRCSRSGPYWLLEPETLKNFHADQYETQTVWIMSDYEWNKGAALIAVISGWRHQRVSPRLFVYSFTLRCRGPSPQSETCKSGTAVAERSSPANDRDAPIRHDWIWPAYRSPGADIFFRRPWLLRLNALAGGAAAQVFTCFFLPVRHKRFAPTGMRRAKCT